MRVSVDGYNAFKTSFNNHFLKPSPFLSLGEECRVVEMRNTTRSITAIVRLDDDLTSETKGLAAIVKLAMSYNIFVGVAE